MVYLLPQSAPVDEQESGGEVGQNEVGGGECCRNGIPTTTAYGDG